MTTAITYRSVENPVLRALSALAYSAAPAVVERSVAQLSVAVLQGCIRQAFAEYAAVYARVEALSKDPQSGQMSVYRAQQVKDSNLPAVDKVKKTVEELGALSLGMDKQQPDEQKVTDALLKEYGALQARAHFFKEADRYSGASVQRLLNEYGKSDKTLERVLAILSELSGMIRLHRNDNPPCRQEFFLPLLRQLMDTIGTFQWKGSSFASLVYCQMKGTEGMDKVTPGNNTSVLVSSWRIAFNNLPSLLKAFEDVERRMKVS